jgi:hypothetical protein
MSSDELSEEVKDTMKKIAGGNVLKARLRIADTSIG